MALFFSNITTEFPINDIIELNTPKAPPSPLAVFSINVVIEKASNDTVLLVAAWIAPPFMAVLFLNDTTEFHEI